MHLRPRLLWAGLLLECAPAHGAESAHEAFVRAISLQRTGDFEGAIREYRAALSQEPGNFEARSNLGVALAHIDHSMRPLCLSVCAAKLTPSGVCSAPRKSRAGVL